MSNFLALVASWWLAGAFASSFYFWFRRTDRSQAPLERRLVAAGHGLAWPMILARALAARLAGAHDHPSGPTTDGHVPRSRSDELVDTGSQGTLPPDIVRRMDVFGRHEFDQARLGDPGVEVWSDIVAPLLPRAHAQPAEFLHRLADAVVPAGGWATYGGERLVKELLTGNLDDPSYHRMMDAALDFLRSLGVPPSRLNSYEWGRWTGTRGRSEPWLPSRPLPAPGQLRLTPLRPNEKRRIAQLEERLDSNTFFVRQVAPQQFIASVNARRSDDDVTRAEWDWKSDGTLYGLYADVGAALQVPPHWCDAELRPFIPFDEPKIAWLPPTH